MYLLDTDIASYLTTGRNTQVKQRFDAIDRAQVALSVITRAELLYGAQAKRHGHPLHEIISDFLRLVPTRAWPVEAAAHHARIRWQLKTQGLPIGEHDMMIAAHALALDAVLVTHNERHFARIDAPLVLENWVAG